MTTNQLRFGELAETIRHNKVTENISSNTLDESVRHNVVGEHWTGAGIAENVRHNVQQETINWYGNETNRMVGLGNVKNSAIANAIQSRNVDNMYDLGVMKAGIDLYAAGNLEEFQKGSLANTQYANETDRTYKREMANQGWVTTNANADERSASAGLSRARTTTEYFGLAEKAFNMFGKVAAVVGTRGLIK